MITPVIEGSIQPASYDLGLGDLYCAGGRYTTFRDEGTMSLQLKFGDFVLLTSYECLSLPDDVVAHAGLVSRRAQSGLVSLFSPQIDPGFQGRLVVPLFNAGQRPITLMQGEPIFTVEFVRTTRPAPRWSDGHRALMGIPSDAIDLESGLTALTGLDARIDSLVARLDRADAERAAIRQRSNRRFTALGVIVGLAAAIFALVQIAFSENWI